MQAQTTYIQRSYAAMTVLVTVALLVGALGGYTLRGAAIQVGPAVASYDSSTTTSSPASRWTHEDAAFTPVQLGPALRWSHEDEPFIAAQYGPVPRSDREGPDLTR